MASKKSQMFTDVGAGGETHQSTTTGALLTTNHGMVISDDQNSLRASERGPTLLEDFVLREKIFHFDHERIPERIVHARGSGAHGYFECTTAIPELTCASLFQTAGKRTPVFARFSTVAGGAGSADTPRDVRGFAVKFYTDRGNWDLVGNNIPVFFIQDAIKFPDLIHAVKMEADRGYPQAASAHDTFWDFASLMPETTHMLMWAMSDRTLPRSLRMMDGFGVHTFRMVDADGGWRFVKFHWRAVNGAQSTSWDEAVKIAGADSDYTRRDLFEAIDSGNPPAWDLAVQVFDQAFADAQPYDVLDATKLIPEEDLPLRVVGRMVLDRNPLNFFAETEQVAFLPTNIVPGIDFSDDPLLQGRLFSYLDTQHSRLGTTNFHQIPINQPKCPYGNFQRDGHMQTEVPVGRANYEPNSLGDAGEDAGPREDPRSGFTTVARLLEDAAPVRVRSELFADHYSQARQFWISQTLSEQGHIVKAFVFELSKVVMETVRVRMLSNLVNVDATLAARVADGLGMDVPLATPAARPMFSVKPSPALSIQRSNGPSLVGRKVAVLVATGSLLTDVEALRSDFTTQGASVVVIGPKVNVMLKGGSLAVDAQLAGSPSVLFDAVAVVLSAIGERELHADPAALQFIRDAFVHLKAIGYTAGAVALLTAAGVDIASDGVSKIGRQFVKNAATRFVSRE